MDFKGYFQGKSLIKTPRVGVHYEQKTTPDLLWCVAHVILDLIKDDLNRVFSDTDVRSSHIFNSLMQDYFSKPPQIEAENEYNKVSSYQLGILTFAGVLQQMSSRPKTYKVNAIEALEYIAVNDLNAVRFLGEYAEKLIQDNGLREVFENYRKNPNQSNHLLAKEVYWKWARTHTAVKGEDRKHTYRVFNKIFNVFCYKNRLPGEDASNITTGVCPYSFLIYNRENFRDKDMPGGMTRQQYDNEILSEVDTAGIVDTLERKSKDLVKKKYNNDSELRESRWGYAPNRVVEVHHMLPKHSYPQFSLSRENLIVLTPDQHRSFAHRGNYRTIDSAFQIICLKKKFEHIQVSLDVGDDFYNLKRFIQILNTCFNWILDENANAEQVGLALATI